MKSLVTQKPQGLISCVSDFAEDISSGKVPIESVGRAGLILLSDTVGGVSGPCLGNVAKKAITASTLDNVATKAITALTLGNLTTKAITASTGKGIIIRLSSTGVSTVTRSVLFYGASRRIITKNEEYRNSSSSYYYSANSSQPSNTNEQH